MIKKIIFHLYAHLIVLIKIFSFQKKIIEISSSFLHEKDLLAREKMYKFLNNFIIIINHQDTKNYHLREIQITMPLEKELPRS